MPSFHPDETLLVEYTAGQLDQATALVVAAHVELCAACQHKADVYLSLASEFLEQSESTPCSEAVLEALLEAVRAPVDVAIEPSVIASPYQQIFYPRVLNTFLEQSPPEKSWQTIGNSLRQMPISKGFNGATCKIMGVKAGSALPKHTHKGDEFVLVLQGGLSDHRGTLHRGDFIHADASVEHTPTAEMGEECICLVVTNGKLKFTGIFGRLLNWVS
jgi:putative transcriptional regulator